MIVEVRILSELWTYFAQVRILQRLGACRDLWRSVGYARRGSGEIGETLNWRTRENVARGYQFSK